MLPNAISTPDTPLAVFRRAYFGSIDQYLAWHDGYQADTACFDALSPAERTQAETELLTALRNRDADARALLGLGHLRSEEALPLLHYFVRQGFEAHYALMAIAQINPAGLDCTLLAEVLTTATNTTQLINLLVGLHEVFTLPQLGAPVARAVLRLFTHPDYLIRYHALNALRHLYHVPAPSPTASAAALRADTLFGLICRKRAPRAYRQAQQLFLAQVPAATLQLFPLSVDKAR